MFGGLIFHIIAHMTPSTTPISKHVSISTLGYTVGECPSFYYDRQEQYFEKSEWPIFGIFS